MAFVALATLPGDAQEPARQTDLSKSGPVFTSGANLVPVKVVVRDKRGNPVEDLDKSDFILRDNGKLQTITRFSLAKSEVLTTSVRATAAEGPELLSRSDEPAIVIPTRFIAYVFDDVHTDIGDLMRSRDAAISQLKETLDPSTRAAVFTVSGQVHLDFTSDIDAMTQTMRGIRRWSADTAPAFDCPPLNYYWANMIVNMSDLTAYDAAVLDFIECTEGLDDDEEEREQQIERSKPTVRSMAFTALSQGQRESSLGLNIIHDVIQRMLRLPGERRIVLVSSGFFLDQTLRFNEQNLIKEAVAAKVTISALDARGVYTVIPGQILESRRATSAQQSIMRDRMQREGAFVQANILVELAHGTGGMFVANTNDYTGSFRKLTASYEVTYMLAFAPSDLKYDGRYHKLDVKLRPRSGLDTKSLGVSSRAGYFEPKAGSRSEAAVLEELRDAIFAREETQDLPVVDFHMRFSRPPNVLEAHVEISLKVNLDNARFHREKDLNTDVLKVVTAAFDHNGNYIKGLQHEIRLRLRDETRDNLTKEGGLSVTAGLDLPPGTFLMRLVVRDSDGSTMTTRNGVVEIP